MLVNVQTRQKRESRRGTHRVRTERIFVQRPVVCERIDIRRPYIWIPRTTQTVVSMLIRLNDQNVGFIHFFFLNLQFRRFS